MLVILTEDSGSGKEFLEMLSRYCYRNKNVISEVYDTGHGDKQLRGNNTKFKQAFEALLRDKRIKKGDILLVCYDSIVPDLDDKRHSKTVQNLTNNLKAVKRLCDKHNIDYRESDYTCFEELLLSYKELLRVTNYKMNDKFDIAFQNKIDTLCKELSKCKSKKERASFYYKYCNPITQLESILARQLELATGSSNKYFKNWFICKARLGECWKEIDCKKNICINDKDKCQSCIVKRYVKTIDALWKNLIHNSNIQELYTLMIK